MTKAGSKDANIIKAKARDLGFDLVGIAPAVTPTGLTRFEEWLARGFAGEMHYLPGRKDAYRHPDGVMPATRSVIALGMHYRTNEPVSPSTDRGRVSRYAWGDSDYHDVLRDRLRSLSAHIHEAHPGCRTRCVVDTAPLLERDFARLAGLGWFGKNTMLINKHTGSLFFLAAILTDVALPADAPYTTDHCGTCTRCLDACPTDAFPEPGVLDARRCLSYLTIELRGPIPGNLRSGMGDWLFGCDVCQDVCPWNRKAPTSTEPEFVPQTANGHLDLIELLELSAADFDRRFGNTPLARPGFVGIKRNACVVLGNQKSRNAIPALRKCTTDEDPVIREAAEWALAQIAEPTSP